MILLHEGQFIARCDNKECHQTLYTGIEELRAYETVLKFIKVGPQQQISGKNKSPSRVIHLKGLDLTPHRGEN
jgi:hypothetical protein